MKKLYSICMIALLSILAVNAQMLQRKDGIKKSKQSMQVSSTARHGVPSSNPHPASIIWTDDFSIASNWVINHEAGATGDWIISSSGPNGQFPIAPIGTIGDFAKFDSDSICNHSLQKANLTTAHPVNLTGHSQVRLTFSQYYRRYYDSTYVYISIDSVNWVKYEVNGNLVANQFSANDNSTVNPEILNVDISALAGNQDSVWVRFQFFSPDTGCCYSWMLDDVSISDIPGIDASLDNIYAGEYCIISVIQAEAFTLQGRLINHGVAPITTGKILFNVYDQNGLLFTDSSAVSASIAPGDTSGVLNSLNPYVPPVTGSYLVEQVVMVPGDGDNTNDTNLVDIFVSDSTIARDLTAIGENVYNGAYGFNANTGVMGAVYHVYHASQFSSATCFFNNPLVGANISVSVYSMNAGMPDTVMGSSYVYQLTAADTFPLTIPFVPWVDVPAGDFFVSVNQLDTTNMGLGFSTQIFTDQKGFFRSGTATAWTALGPANLPLVPIVRVNNPSGTLLNTEKVAVETPFNVYPNPSSGMIYVAGKGTEKDVTVTVLNSMGQIVKTAHFNTLTINRVDLHNLSAGMYTVSIKSAKGETNKTIILQ